MLLKKFLHTRNFYTILRVNDKEKCKKLIVCNFSTENKETYVPKQYIDSAQVLERKIHILADLIKNAKYPIFFTGAGISTSLGIPDYRSGQNTMIQTGPGLWNRPEQQVKQIQKTRNVLIDALIPSKTHMAICTLIQKNIFKHVVSQNTDGLHLRSGIKKSNLSQLHGNRNLQFCTKCSKKYLRDFRTIRPQQKHFKPGQKRDHLTGRLCQNCNGQLNDSIIYFGQKLNKDEITKSYQEGSKSDLCVAIGSSLTVKPSANVPLLPLQYQQNGKLVIINIQQTPLDKHASLKLNAFCDDVVQKLMSKLDVEIMPYKIQRFLQVMIQKQYEGWLISINGVDEHHYNFSFIKNIQVLKDLNRSSTYPTNSSQKQIQTSSTTTISQLKNKFLFKLSQHQHQNLHHINFNIKFFGPMPDLQINLNKLISEKDIIGREDIIVKIVSINNEKWTVMKAGSG